MLDQPFAPCPLFPAAASRIGVLGGGVTVTDSVGFLCGVCLVIYSLECVCYDFCVGCVVVC